MRVTFLVPSTTRAIGGVIALYEFANGLSRLGHTVHLAHLPVVDGHIRELGEIDWFPFEPAVEHQVVGSVDRMRLPAADVIETTGQKFFARAWPDGTAAEPLAPTAGLPFLFVQAYQYLTPDVEQLAFEAPCPKLCVARWMMRALRADGVPEEQVVHVPYGLDHEVYRLVRPIAGRSRQVTMLYNAHPVKCARVGIAAIEEVQRRLPGTRAVLFGNHDARDRMPNGIEYVNSPSRAELVGNIYNESRVFACSSVREGFGLCAIEAMAGGCALVTTDNGGSDEYAVDGDTALVCEPNDVNALADRIERLLRDNELCEGIATRGHAFVQRFDWDASARQLEQFLVRYAEAPARFQR